MKYFITAIGTDSGKTLVSAVIVHALKADYWKPIQAGKPTDTDTIKNLLGDDIFCHPEAYSLNTPASPHSAALTEGITIRLEDIKAPVSEKDLVIEGAGGVLVPLNNNDFVIDIATKESAELILVSNNYLGSINHTLLTLDYLKSKNYNLKGIIFNGKPNKDTEDIILHHSNCPCLLRIPELSTVNRETIIQLASELKL
ncbi:MAG: dethiobiotin synthase [Bacteroidota bacterium]